MKPIKIIEKFNKLEEENEFYGIIYDKKWHSELIKSFLKSSQENLIKEIIEEIIELRNKKFPRGERQWCVECANRFYKELINKLKEI